MIDMASKTSIKTTPVKVKYVNPALPTGGLAPSPNLKKTNPVSSVAVDCAKTDAATATFIADDQYKVRLSKAVVYLGTVLLPMTNHTVSGTVATAIHAEIVSYELA